MAPKNIPRCRNSNSEDLEPHRECGIRPREKATGCLDCQGQSEPSKLPHCHTPTSIQVISLDHFHYYLVTMLAFPIRVSGEIKDEPWGSDDDKSEPPRSSSKFRTSSRKPRWINRKRVSASGNFVVIHANILGCFSYASCILA